MYNFEDVMSRLDDIEAKLDQIIEARYTYTQLSTYTHKNRRAEVTQREDGIYCVHKFVNDNLIAITPMGIHNESFAEDAAENYVFQVGDN